VPRRTHRLVPEEEAIEHIPAILKIRLAPEMVQFLETEARRLSERGKKPRTVQDVLRALVAAYYEKRMIGLLLDPND
jgi:CRISPR/Cas system-associated protein Csm6